jgi:glycosyltransferase involved in cell wall biosynthesis
MNSERISSTRKPSVSIIIVCYNEEENIGRFLKSLQWCDEIVVIDSFSSDRTVEICRQYTEIVIQREWAGYRDQKAFAHSKATKDWALMIDSDEEVTPELQHEIRQYLAEKRIALCRIRVAAIDVLSRPVVVARWLVSGL